MVERRIWRRLQPIVTRVRRLWFSTLLAMAWITIAALGLTFALIAERSQASPVLSPTVLAVIAVIALVLTYLVAWRRSRNFHHVAQKIEKYYPDLNARLLTAMEQQPDEKSGYYTFLQERVIREALYHDHRHPWYRAVPGNRLLLSYFACLAALVLVCTAAWRLSNAARPFADEPARAGLQMFIPGAKSQFTVQPGNVDVERGTSLLITARFHTAAPPEVLLVAAGNANEQQIRMTRSLDDPLFGARLEDIQEALAYHIEFEQGRSREFRVNVFDFPRLERADAELEFPSYTSLESKQLTDVRRISAVEGSRLKLICHMNKPLASAALVAGDGERVKLTPSSEDPVVYHAELELTRSERWRFELADAEGRKQKLPAAELVIQVTPNQPPDLKWVAPGRDTRVSPLEELLTAGTVFDDYGVVRHGLSYRHAQSDAVDVVLGEQRAGGERHPFQHVIDLESLNAEPDELVSYHLWAEDIGPNGEVRRVFSDMYFAEVRPFEEIFRQGQSSPSGAEQQQQQGGAGGAGQQAEELAELQKQIINGTWNLLRRELDRQPSEMFVTDVQVLSESQESALEQLEAMGAEVRDPKSLAHLDTARQAMQSAVQQLTSAAAEKEVEKLNEALTAEQEAYQSLLRLRAREHEVVRANQSASASSAAGGSSSRAQQELQQLQLNDDQNRYETERTAQSENSQQREMRQALNRLRELARRQGDLNERIKELQSALEQAQTERERKELENQLKRLREEQEQILRDTDELQQRMDQPGNQEQMADERQQLEQTRENVRRASEALEEGRLSEAATSGTRAERELRDLQEDFRRQTSNQYEEEMRDMRSRAQQLQEDEQQIAEDLEQLIGQESQSLRPSDERQRLEQSLQQQEQRIDELLESMRETVQQAEQDEPLLSRRLYDTYRQTQQDNPQEALRQATQWMQQGFPDQAQQPEQIARAGIQRLAEGVEEAARGILGDETEALRRARDELDQLAEQLAEEMDRANPGARGDADDEQDGTTADTRPRRADNAQPSDQDAQQQQGNPQQGNQQQGQKQGNQQGSQQQGGEQQGGQQPGSAQQDSQQQNSEQQGGQQQDGQQQDGQQQDGQQQDGQQQDGEQPEGQQQGSQQQEGQQQSGQQQSGNQQSGNQQSGSESGPNSGGERNEQDEQGELTGAEIRERQQGGSPAGLGGGGPGGNEGDWTDRIVDILEGAQDRVAPLTGDDYGEWSDRLRDVEEILDDPELRAEAARIRERAREMRVEWKRHSKTPEWELVFKDVQQPLVELKDRVAEELRRRSGGRELAPVDRDPVPAEFEEHVRRYYEQLGSGR